jgi:hypothetical protein
MNPDKTCKNCLYAADFCGDDIKDDDKIYCRRHAPSPVSAFRYYIGEVLRDIAYSSRSAGGIVPPEEGGMDDVATEATETPAYSTWPEVSGDDWCGEWRSKDT